MMSNRKTAIFIAVSLFFLFVPLTGTVKSSKREHHDKQSIKPEYRV